MVALLGAGCSELEVSESERPAPVQVGSAFPRSVLGARDLHRKCLPTSQFLDTVGFNI